MLPIVKRIGGFAIGRRERRVLNATKRSTMQRIFVVVGVARTITDVIDYVNARTVRIVKRLESSAKLSIPSAMKMARSVAWGSINASDD